MGVDKTQLTRCPNSKLKKVVLVRCCASTPFGNTRLLFADGDNDGSIDAETEVLSVKNYYVFGMLWESSTNTSPKNAYGYNGKELDTDFGFNLHFYGTRLHDSALGRFTTIDRIADNFAFVSPYNYAENRVPNGIDLYGLQYAPFGPATFHSKSFNKEQHAKDVKQFISRNAGNELAIGFTPAGVALDFRDVGQAIGDRDATGFGFAMIGFLPGGDFFKGRKLFGDARKSFDEVGEFGGGLGRGGFSQLENEVIGEAGDILNSKNFEKLREGLENGKFTEVEIGGRKISFEPGIPERTGISAMTNGNGFVLSSRAFSSSEELTKTILQEVHRLHFSTVVKTGSVNANTAASTTRDAYNFAEEAFKTFK